MRLQSLIYLQLRWNYEELITPIKILAKDMPVLPYVICFLQMSYLHYTLELSFPFEVVMFKNHPILFGIIVLHMQVHSMITKLRLT